MRYLLPIWFIVGISGLSVSAQDQLEKLPAGINTQEYDESTPVLSRNGTMMFFTRTADPDFNRTLLPQDSMVVADAGEVFVSRLATIYSQIAGHEITDPLSSYYNQDIWFTSLAEDVTGAVQHPGYPLNNALPNSLVSTGMHPDEYVVLNQFYSDGSMYSGFSRVVLLEDGQSSRPEPMHIYQFDLTGSDVNMTMTPDGHVLVISMARSDSDGQSDLYVSFFVRENVWSAPIHMGHILNSPFQEVTPHISVDKRYLYFASNRPGGPGGHDLYVSERLDYTWLNWSAPVLIPGDINTRFDESQPFFDPQRRYLYFSSRRDGTSDIFRERLVPKPRLKQPLHIKGKIVSSATGKPVHAELLWGQLSSDGYLEYFNSYTGHFEMLLTEYDTYKFLPRKPNHTSRPILIDPRSLEQQGVDSLEIVLMVDPPARDDETLIAEAHDTAVQTPVPANPTAGQSLVLYDINFVKGKATILSKSKKALGHVLDMMIRHPSLEILVEGHTDNVGDELSLLQLSLERAKAVQDYLVHEGIAVERISVAGMGATKPLADNMTERTREQNRRVEIKIMTITE